MLLLRRSVNVMNALPMLDCWFVHDVPLIIFYFDCCIDDYCVIIPILDYVLVYLVVFILLAPYACTDFGFSFCASGLVF